MVVSMYTLGLMAATNGQISTLGSSRSQGAGGWCRTPANGPSMPDRRSLQTNTLRLRGIQQLTRQLSVEAQPGEHQHGMPPPEAKQQPVFQRRLQ